MLFVDHARWGQTPEDLRRLATSAPHRRTRERFLALYEITQECCATQVATRTGRHPQTVMGWLHAYNAHGPDVLVYRRTGGRPPFVPASKPALARSFVMPNARPPTRL
jgi:transposase